jgi:hypothetical protein
MTSSVLGAALSRNVGYQTDQDLTDTQKAQGRANIDALKKNYIINGAMMVSQENGTTAVTTSGSLPADQFIVVNTSSGTFSAQQVASATLAGSPNRLRVTVTAADAAVAAGDVFSIYQPIEGLRVTDLKSGTSAAKTVTIQFGCKAPAGTYSVALRNGVPDRSYVAEYTIAPGEANTDVVKSVTLALDQTGTWASGNTVGMYVQWCLMAGADFWISPNTWTAYATGIGSPNQFNFMGTLSNVFELFDVSLTEGSVAPAFQVPDYASELALCQRYIRILAPESVGIANGTTAVLFQVRHAGMRAAPSSSATNLITVTDIFAANFTQSSGAATINNNSADAGLYQVGNLTGLTSARVYMFTGSSAGLIKLNARL